MTSTPSRAMARLDHVTRYAVTLHLTQREIEFVTETLSTEAESMREDDDLANNHYADLIETVAGRLGRVWRAERDQHLFDRAPVTGPCGPHDGPCPPRA